MRKNLEHFKAGNIDNQIFQLIMICGM